MAVREIDFSKTASSSITKATILRAAWAVVLARYCETDDITFGTSISGRQAPVANLVDMPGPAIATIPIRIRLGGEKTISSYLQQVQDQAMGMVPYEQYGLQNIAKLGQEAADAINFSSLLVIQPASQLASIAGDAHSILALDDSSKFTTEEFMQDYFTYPLVIQGRVSEESVEVILIYNSDVLNETLMEGLSRQYEHVVQQLLTENEDPLSSISIAGNWDLSKAIEWNSHHKTNAVEDLLHAQFERQAALRPNKVAVKGWDYEMTYCQLNQAANRLAHHLVNAYGVQLDDFIHVCFEKSFWFIVAILAINKAGACWVPLDPSHPFSRKEQITSQTQAKVALASATTSEMLDGLVPASIVVDEILDNKLKQATDTSDTGPSVAVTPRHACYTLFTSGSTGVPKGFVIEHASLCTSQNNIWGRIGMSEDVRMMQFASYVFDMSVGEIVSSLTWGGTLFVPSEDQKLNNLVDFITDNNINWVFATPAFLRTMDPAKIPGVELILLAGEAVTQDILNTWLGNTRLVNAWGPAEIVFAATLHEYRSNNEIPATIGSPVGGNVWIVDPNDYTKLAPIGTIGEALIQGPTVLREYLSDPVKTSETVITDLPEWAPRRHEPGWNRMYKSGDLVYYNPDGTIVFSSRKDTQVKIRGLRVELGEVESRVLSSLPGVQQTVVDVLRSESGTTLVAYFSYNSTLLPEQRDCFVKLTSDMQRDVKDMIGELRVSLPNYMIPSLFVPCDHMPSITSTKIDRNRLRTLTLQLSRKDRSSYSLVDVEKRAVETPMEYRIQAIWAKILRLSIEDIGRDDSFLGIGGDSITAIQFVTTARDSGVSVTVRDVFDDPRLFVVASKCSETRGRITEEVAPFSLLSASRARVAQSASMQEQCGLFDDQKIVDAYPCTPLQSGLIAVTMQQPGAYIVKHVYRLPKSVNLEAFMDSWEETVNLCSNLRTRIVSL